jgi:hypothetical protein
LLFNVRRNTSSEVYAAEKSDAIQRLADKLVNPRQVYESALARDLNDLRERTKS